MTTLHFIEAVAALSMPIGVVFLLWSRTHSGQKGLGWRVIQFAAIMLMLPTILILALEKAINSEVAGTLLGAAIGYFFSRGGGDDSSQGVRASRSGRPASGRRNRDNPEPPTAEKGA